MKQGYLNLLQHDHHHHNVMFTMPIFFALSRIYFSFLRYTKLGFKIQGKKEAALCGFALWETLLDSVKYWHSYDFSINTATINIAPYGIRLKPRPSGL